jgi:hypothetical protein
MWYNSAEKLLVAAETGTAKQTCAGKFEKVNATRRFANIGRLSKY